MSRRCLLVIAGALIYSARTDGWLPESAIRSDFPAVFTLTHVITHKSAVCDRENHASEFGRVKALL